MIRDEIEILMQNTISFHLLAVKRYNLVLFSPLWMSTKSVNGEAEFKQKTL